MSMYKNFDGKEVAFLSQMHLSFGLLPQLLSLLSSSGCKTKSERFCDPRVDIFYGTRSKPDSDASADFSLTANFRLIGLTGGIGSGKSVVSRILRLRGEAVYDCDLEARRLMETDGSVRKGLLAICGPEVFTQTGGLDRKYLGSRLFSEPALREAVNTLVHGAVIEDIQIWRTRLQNEGRSRGYVESAILFSSGIDRLVDKVWIVCAPEEERIRRVCLRNGLSEEQVRERILAQSSEVDAFLLNEQGLTLWFIRNGDRNSLLSELDLVNIDEGGSGDKDQNIKAK